jgi:hypothetical protein
MHNNKKFTFIFFITINFVAQRFLVNKKYKYLIQKCGFLWIPSKQKYVESK